MPWVILAAVAAGLWAGVVYLARERLGATGLGLTLLRTCAIAATAGLLLNAALWRSRRPGPATVLLDASLSMTRAGTPWTAALDTAVALAGRDGVVLRFGDGVAPFDSAPPTEARSSVSEALRAAAGRGGPIYVVTDGELDDFAGLPADLRRRAALVLLPRAAGAGVALTEASVPARVLPEDSVTVAVEVTTWGGFPDSTAELEVRAGNRRLRRLAIAVPAGAGQGRRTVTLSPGALPAGAHVLAISVAAAGDADTIDNVRLRVVEVTTVPALVLLASPPDWESRFLTRELADIAPGGLRALGELAGGRWIDLRTQRPAAEQSVRDAVRAAAAVVVRGSPAAARGARNAWWWTGGQEPAAIGGDWYVTGDVPASPLAGRLAGIPWDSLPPVTGVVPGDASQRSAVLTARLGRRGAQRVVVAARDSAGRRELVTAAEGLWRWALRGGAPREAYRALLGAGVEWLVGAGTARAGRPLVAEAAVPRGTATAFRWQGGTAPKGPVEVELAGPDSTVVRMLVFGADGVAAVRLDPGVYRWRAPALPGTGGLVVVEAYSNELVPRVPVTSEWRTAGVPAERVGLRTVWWVFGIAVLAFLAEWGWRMRRGLP